MEQALSVTDFHIERSVKFLRWKYGNLRVGYHMLSIDKDGETECIVAFSEVYNSGFDVAPIKGVTVYDLVIAPTSKLTTKQVVLHIAYRLKERGESFDGIQMLSDCCYLGKLRYPFHKCAVMSTVADKIQRGYLTFADHDMDQI
jgi:hypothetical protein